MRFARLFGLGLAAGLIALPAAAQCDFTSTLDFGNTALAEASTGPYATACINLTSPTTASITFMANAGFSFGGKGSVAANGSFTTTSVTGNSAIQTDHHGNSIYRYDEGNISSFGTFAAQIDSPGATKYASSIIILDVTANSGTTWDSAADVLLPNAFGYDAAAHIFRCGNKNCTVAAVSGFAGNSEAGDSGGTEIPEPASLVLMATALASLGALTCWRKLK